MNTVCDIVQFTVEGAPQPKHRHRRGRTRTGEPITHDDPRNKPNAVWIRLCYLRQIGNERPPWEGPVRLSVQAHFLPPASWPDWKRELLASLPDGLPYTIKPDSDNLLKMVEDALTGLAWRDDAQVDSSIVRTYARQTETIIEISFLAPVPRTKKELAESPWARQLMVSA